MSPRPVVVACTVLVLACVAGCGAGPPVGTKRHSVADTPDPFSFAVVGDIPDAAADVDALPQRLRDLTEQAGVDLITHLGDITDGNCSTDYFQRVKSAFEAAAAPVVYTPGDNEWADCRDRDPFESLAALRAVFFDADAGGENAFNRVVPDPAFPENVLLDGGDATLLAMHLVGPHNNASVSTGPESARNREVAARTAAAVAIMEQGLARARERESAALVLLTQADMFELSLQGDLHRQVFAPVVSALASLARRFDGTVYLLNGDTHAAKRDLPLVNPVWRDYYGIGESVSNLRRYTVEGGPGVGQALVVTVDAGLVSVRRITL